MKSPTTSGSAVKRAKIKRGLGFVISVVCLIFVVNRLNWPETLLALRGVKLSMLTMGGLLILSSYLIQTVRWRSLLVMTHTLSFWCILRFLMIGLLGNAILPFRAGDILRAYLIRRAVGHGGTLAVSSIIVERLFDVFAMLSFSVAIGLIFELPAKFTEVFIPIAALCSLGGLFILLLAFFGDKTFMLLKHSLRSFKSTIIDSFLGIFRQLVDAMQAVGSLGKLLKLMGLSFAIWGIVVVAMWCFIAAFRPDLPLVAGGLLMVTTHLGAVIPSAPASIGVYHAIAVVTLALWKVNAETAMAMALVSHGVMVGLQIIGGAISAWIEGGVVLTNISNETTQSG